MKKIILFVSLLISVSASWPKPCLAQSVESSQLMPPVKLESLVDELVRKNPELQALRKRYEAALTRPAQVGSAMVTHGRDRA
jgi:hypothetical protein